MGWPLSTYMNRRRKFQFQSLTKQKLFHEIFYLFLCFFLVLSSSWKPLHSVYFQSKTVWHANLVSGRTRGFNMKQLLHPYKLWLVRLYWQRPSVRGLYNTLAVKVKWSAFHVKFSAFSCGLHKQKRGGWGLDWNWARFTWRLGWGRPHLLLLLYCFQDLSLEDACKVSQTWQHLSHLHSSRVIIMDIKL